MTAINRKTDTKQDVKLNAKLTQKVWFGIGLALLLVATIFSQLVFSVNPITAGRYFIAQVGSVIGMSTAVPPNPFNILSQQLKEKEETLLEKEADLAEKEKVLTKKMGEERDGDNKTLIIGGILLILILLNFYLDYKKRKNSTNGH